MKIDDVKEAIEMVEHLKPVVEEVYDIPDDYIDALNMAQRCMLAVIGLKEEYGG